MLLGIVCAKKMLFTFVASTALMLVLGLLYFSTTYEEYLGNSYTNVTYQKNLSFPSLTSLMQTIPWTDYAAALEINGSESEKVIAYSNFLLTGLIPFLIKSPLTPINNSCKAPPLVFPDYPLNCNRRTHPRKVGILLQFGYDVDTLEIHLNELDEVVDHFFLIESIKPHKPLAKSKPLFWDRIKYDDRFSKFSHKIVHFIVDDELLAKADAKEDKAFTRENLQERLRWEKFLEWNTATNYFQLEDILGFGDVDEIPYRNNVHFLKHCNFTYPVDIGIWFPFGSINSIFQTDYPVDHHPYTLGDPTFWTLQKALSYGLNGDRYPSRRRGSSGTYLLGGMHMSTYGYPPFRIAKFLTASEADAENVVKLINVGKQYMLNEIEEAESQLNSVPWLENRIQSVQFLRDNNATEANLIIKIPWFYDCNRNRYPSLENKHDSRLD